MPEAVWSKRYAQINAFERRVIAAGTTVIKVMTHISKDEQKARLMERLDRPDKHYKYNPGDVDERSHWGAYMEAYQAVLDKTSTVGAPWHVVPSDRKWYARLAVQQAHPRGPARDEPPVAAGRLRRRGREEAPVGEPDALGAAGAQTRGRMPPNGFRVVPRFASWFVSRLGR